MHFNKTQKRRQILAESLSRQNQAFLEIKNKVIKSLKKNKNQKLERLFYNQNFLFPKTNKFIHNKQQNRCLFTGRIKGFNQVLSASRHTVKKLAVYG